MINHQENFQKNGFIIHPKMLDGELLDFVGIHAYNIARLAGPNPTDSQVPNTPAFYDDFVMANLQDYLLPRIEKATGLELYPTYTYFRVYKKGDELLKHKDRQSCEISMTLCLRYNLDEEIWPIFIENHEYKRIRELGKGNTAKARLQMGDAIVYHGCECEHWREPYTEGTKLAQVFIHYVDKNGPFADYKNDKHPGKYFAQYK
jgi:hypothetical protein